MGIVVQKYGGTSVGDAERIRRVADRIARTRRQGHDVVVAVSAMGDTTDELVALAGRVSKSPPARELDLLLTSGERISMALLAMALHELGVPAKSFTGSQAGIITDEVHGKARIKNVTPGRLHEAIDAGNVVIVAGYQGVSDTTKDVTALGRGGTDVTAVALAAALGADVCEIYTDVDGVYTADPRIVPDARKLDFVTFEEMLELAAQGAKVLMVRSVEFGRNHGVRIHVRSSFSYAEGTWVGPEEEHDMEDAIISGVAHDTSEAKLTVQHVKDRPGQAAKIFTALAAANINIDMIVQNVSEDGATDISCTLPEDDCEKAKAAIAALDDVEIEGVSVDSNIAKVSLVGAGMKTHPGIAAKMFATLSDAGVNIGMISTSTIRVSVVIDEAEVETAVNAIHTAFGLGVA